MIIDTNFTTLGEGANVTTPEFWADLSPYELCEQYYTYILVILMDLFTAGMQLTKL